MIFLITSERTIRPDGAVIRCLQNRMVWILAACDVTLMNTARWISWMVGMSSSSLISTLSLVIALLALVVAVWQARRTTRLTRNAHQIQVIADVFREIRSAEFLGHYRRILDFPKSEELEDGFNSLSEECKESAYTVGYFFEHLGVLVTRELVPGDVLITTMRTYIVRSWDALECAINAELKVRATYPQDAGRDFLPHFRKLCDMARTHQGDNPGLVTVRPPALSSPPESDQLGP